MPSFSEGVTSADRSVDAILQHVQFALTTIRVPRRFPASLAPVEFGSFFAALSKPR